MVPVDFHCCDRFAFADARNRFLGILNGTLYRL